MILLFNWVTCRWTSSSFSGFFSSTFQAKSPKSWKSSIDLPGWLLPCSPRMLHNQPSSVLIEDLQLETPQKIVYKTTLKRFWILWSFTTSKLSFHTFQPFLISSPASFTKPTTPRPLFQTPSAKDFGLKKAAFSLVRQLTNRQIFARSSQ